MNISTSERVKVARERENLTMQDMADLLGVTRPTYARMENKGHWKLEQLRVIAKRFGVDVKELIG